MKIVARSAVTEFVVGPRRALRQRAQRAVRWNPDGSIADLSNVIGGLPVIDDADVVVWRAQQP